MIGEFMRLDILRSCQDKKGEKMPTKSRQALVLLFFLLAFVPFQKVAADTGPKPTMDFTFQQEFSGAAVSITSGILYECEQADCQDAKPLMEAGPQRFTCDAASCSALAYGFSPYHRLEIQFSDGKTRSSNIFTTGQFNSYYTVTVRQDDLLVTSKFGPSLFSPLPYILVCACCLVGVALLVVAIILLRRRSAKKKK